MLALAELPKPGPGSAQPSSPCFPRFQVAPQASLKCRAPRPAFHSLPLVPSTTHIPWFGSSVEQFLPSREQAQCEYQQHIHFRYRTQNRQDNRQTDSKHANYLHLLREILKVDITATTAQQQNPANSAPDVICVSAFDSNLGLSQPRSGIRLFYPTIQGKETHAPLPASFLTRDTTQPRLSLTHQQP